MVGQGLLRRLVLAAAALSVLAMLGKGGPALAVTLNPADLDRLGAVAKTEGLPLSQSRALGKRVELSSLAVVDRATFVRRASLVAYVVFRRLLPPVDEVSFEAKLPGGASQSLRIRRADLEAYLADRLTRAAYEDRIAYASEAPGAVGATRPLPTDWAPTAPDPSPYPSWSGPFPSAQPSPMPTASPLGFDWQSLSPAGVPLVSFGYTLGLAPARYDAFSIEYGHPLWPWLDARAGLLVLSSASPLNALAGAGRPLDGLAGNLDLMATTRQNPGPLGLALEAGLGGRVLHGSSLGGAPLGPLGSASLRVAGRWKALSLGLRYPLWRRADDPSASWELNLSYCLPFASFGGL